VHSLLRLLTQVAGQNISIPLVNAMIDKSATEICALTQLGMQHFLCLFHLLQDWERYLRSAESGVKLAEDRLQILADLKQLAATKELAAFNIKQDNFLRR
jgi:hypothetical protein